MLLDLHLLNVIVHTTCDRPCSTEPLSLNAHCLLLFWQWQVFIQVQIQTAEFTTCYGGHGLGAQGAYLCDAASSGFLWLTHHGWLVGCRDRGQAFNLD